MSSTESNQQPGMAISGAVEWGKIIVAAAAFWGCVVWLISGQAELALGAALAIAVLVAIAGGLCASAQDEGIECYSVRLDGETDEYNAAEQ